jgi:hypothetical protein
MLNHKISRRNLLKVAGFFTITPWQAQKDLDLSKYPTESVRVLQSVTSRDSTLIVVLAHRASEIQISIRAKFNVEKVDLGLGEYLLYQILVTDLRPGERYRLEIFDKTHSKFHSRFFKSLDTSNPSPKIAFMTCSSHRGAEPQEVMFEQLNNEKPDLILFPGDLVYGNSSMDTVLGRPAKPSEAYTIYCKTFLDLDFYSQNDLVPVFSSWDDHDLAFNNSEYNHPNLSIMTRMFRSFYPADNRISGIETGPGIAYSFEAFGSRFTFLDVRTFLDKQRRIFLGAEQLNWVTEKIKNTQGPHFIVSALQFWNYGRLAENYQAIAPVEFDRFLSFVKGSSVPSVFLSGDVHYSQVQKLSENDLGYQSYEISSSALFSLSARAYGLRSKEKGQLHYYGYPNFLIFENVNFSSQTIQAKVRCVTEKTSNEFSFPLQVSSKK